MYKLSILCFSYHRLPTKKVLDLLLYGKISNAFEQKQSEHLIKSHRNPLIQQGFEWSRRLSSNISIILTILIYLAFYSVLLVR